ncbi:Phenylacetate-coenzyme A ligase [compost metagenome]
MIKTTPLSDLVRYARMHSPFYRDLYRDVADGPVQLTDLPVIDQDAFWAANSPASNRLMTGPASDGIAFKSGGTSGNPKFSFFSRDEWVSFCEAFGRGMSANGLTPGEKVANIFYGGELYASFLFITKSIEHAPTGAVVYPVMGATDPDVILHILEEHQIDVLAGVPSSIIQLAGHAERSPGLRLGLKKILFGGEAFYPDQRAYLERVFPGVDIRSVGYASVDAGLLGYADLSCGLNEHRTFGTETHFEILDEETGLPIEEVGRPGKVVITELTRRLMPIIRYPAGDLAEWVEPAGGMDRKFRILGRSEEGARIGPMTLYLEDVRKILAELGDLGIIDFQVLVTHDDRRDRLTLRLAVSDPSRLQAADSQRVIETLYSERPMFSELVQGDKIHAPEIAWIREDALERNPRTGKLKRIIDRR